MTIIIHYYNDTTLLCIQNFTYIDIHIDTFDTTTTPRNHPLFPQLHTTPAIPKQLAIYNYIVAHIVLSSISLWCNVAISQLKVSIPTHVSHHIYLRTPPTQFKHIFLTTQMPHLASLFNDTKQHIHYVVTLRFSIYIILLVFIIDSSTRLQH